MIDHKRTCVFGISVKEQGGLSPLFYWAPLWPYFI